MSSALDCIFCKIIQKEIPSQIVFENHNIFAFKDAQPQAPYHFLVVPKEHLTNILEINPKTTPMVSDLVMTATDLAKKYGFSDNGFRLVFNCNKDGGQSVHHLHLHVLGGRTMQWPPG